MKVTEILMGLESDGYVGDTDNPRAALFVRIGKLAGVKSVGEGLYVCT
jgi:hypothetical protein